MMNDVKAMMNPFQTNLNLNKASNSFPTTIPCICCM